MSVDIEKPELESESSASQWRRLDVEWTTVVATREMAGIALKRTKTPTYSESLRLASELVPNLFRDGQSMLLQDEEGSTAREFRQKARAESLIRKVTVNPVDLMDEEMFRLDSQIAVTEDNDALRRRQEAIHRAREELTFKRIDEHAAIFRDANVSRDDLPFSGGHRYREFKLPNDRILRVRVFHPVSGEPTTGVDLIYEHYWNKRRRVRVAALQYKMWEDKILYIDERACQQIQRMENVFCRNQFCEAKEQSVRQQGYRLPFCSVFLRPTDRLQNRDSNMLTSGYHVPICVIRQLLQDRHSIDSSYFRSETLSHKVFEELFNIGMVGSGWLPYEELERLYKEHKVLEEGERIIIYAQEYSAPD